MKMTNKIHPHRPHSAIFSANSCRAIRDVVRSRSRNLCCFGSFEAAARRLVFNRFDVDRRTEKKNGNLLESAHLP